MPWTVTPHADGQNLDIGSQCPDGGRDLDGGLGFPIRLGQDHDHLGSAIPAHDEETLETTRRKGPVQSMHDEYQVHVGHQDLLDDRLGRVTARHRVGPFQHTRDQRTQLGIVGYHHPVASGRRQQVLGTL